MTETVPAKPEPTCPECGHPLNCTSLKLADLRVTVKQIEKAVRELRAREREYAAGNGWTPEVVCAARAATAPDLERVVVAVSPAPADEETGIIAAGRDADGDCYVLADRSAAGTPRESMWSALRAHDEYRADVIAGAVNLVGGYMESLLYCVRANQEGPWRPDLAYRAVTVRRDLSDRLKPVGALYRAGRAHHVGAFPELEDRMFTWMPGDCKPMGRIEALVVALTELGSRA